MVILFDQFNLPEDVYEVIFATEQQIEVAKLLIAEFKQKNGELTKSEMSDFATRLHDGITVERVMKIGLSTQRKQETLSYNKRQFYDRILTPMKSMGLVDYDLYKKNYRISEKFGKIMQKVASMWNTETGHSALGIKRL